MKLGECVIAMVLTMPSVVFPQQVPCNSTIPVFVDDFQDEEADGWSLVSRGIWSVEGGELREGTTSDWTQGYVEDFDFAGQLVEANINTHGGYAGLVFWRRDEDNFVSVSVYPASAGLRVLEVSGGRERNTNYGLRAWPDTWYELGVCADAMTGELAVYLDGSHLLTHQTSTSSRRRSGSSGVFTGNASASFDDFKVSVIPESPTLDSNLIIDPGFEFVGPLNRLLAWPNTEGGNNEATALSYAEGITGPSRPPRGGGNFFYSGMPTALGTGSLRQDIDLSFGETALPSALGNAKFQLSGSFTSREEKTDASLVRAVFSNFFGELGIAEIGGSDFVEALQFTNGQREWGQDSLIGDIPAGTDHVQIQLVPVDAGVTFEGFVDDLDFRVFAPPTLSGDYDGDGFLGLGDIDALGREIAARSTDPTFDLTGDGLVGGEDLNAILGLVDTINGDADLDGRVGFSDFLILSANFGLNSPDAAWSKGDFITDNRINFTDFLILSTNFGESYSAGISVPEPVQSTSSLCWCMAFLLVTRRGKTITARQTARSGSRHIDGCSTSWGYCHCPSCSLRRLGTKFARAIVAASR